MTKSDDPISSTLDILVHDLTNNPSSRIQALGKQLEPILTKHDNLDPNNPASKRVDAKLAGEVDKFGGKLLDVLIQITNEERVKVQQKLKNANVDENIHQDCEKYSNALKDYLQLLRDSQKILAGANSAEEFLPFVKPTQELQAEIRRLRALPHMQPFISADMPY